MTKTLVFFALCAFGACRRYVPCTTQPVPHCDRGRELPRGDALTAARELAQGADSWIEQAPGLPEGLPSDICDSGREIRWARRDRVYIPSDSRPGMYEPEECLRADVRGH